MMRHMDMHKHGASQKSSAIFTLKHHHQHHNPSVLKQVGATPNAKVTKTIYFGKQGCRLYHESSMIGNVKLFRDMMMHHFYSYLFCFTAFAFLLSFLTQRNVAMTTIHVDVNPFPPIYSAGPLTWETPLFITPTALLSLIAFLGLGRYLSTRSHPLFVDAARLNRQRRLTALSKLVLAMSITILLTFMVDAGIFTARAILDKHWTSTVLAYYIGVSWLAWILGLMGMIHEAHNFGRWSWVQYTFWMTATLGESLIAWLWFVAFLSPRTGKQQDAFTLSYSNPTPMHLGTIFDKYDFMFLGTFAMRYGLEVGTMVLCLIQMFIREPPSREWSPLISTQAAASSSYGSTEAFQKGQQPTTTAPVPTHSSYSKLCALLSYTWPRGSLWLQLLMFLCFLLMWVAFAINAMTPLAMGMLVDSLGHTKCKQSHQPHGCRIMLFMHNQAHTSLFV